MLAEEGLEGRLAVDNPRAPLLNWGTPDVPEAAEKLCAHRVSNRSTQVRRSFPKTRLHGRGQVVHSYATYEKKRVDATFPEVAEPLDGPICQELANTARRHQIALVAGVVETSEEPGKAYNTLVAFGPDGARLAFYRKIHLFDAQGFEESTFIERGPSTSPVVFESGGASYGLMTCYDLRFPELARSLADAGAQVLLVCSSWVPGNHKTEQWLACARPHRCRWAGAF